MLILESMLILDKQRAVEHVMALTSTAQPANPEEQSERAHARTYHRVAIYERRPASSGVPARRAERRRRRMRLFGGASPA